MSVFSAGQLIETILPALQTYYKRASIGLVELLLQNVFVVDVSILYRARAGDNLRLSIATRTNITVGTSEPEMNQK